MLARTVKPYNSLRGASIGVRYLSNLPVNQQNVVDNAIARQHLLVPYFEPAATDPVNAPTTLPIAVETTRDPNVPALKHLVGLGKSFVKLYKQGIVNVWKNYRFSLQYRKQNQVPHVSALTQKILDDSFGHSLEHEGKAVQPTWNHITRAEYQTLLRTERDFKKLPLFAAVFAVFFEMTPVLVMLFPRITPGTCTLPFQRKRDLARANANIALLKQLHADASPKRFSTSVHRLTETELQGLAKALFPHSALPLSLYPRRALEHKVQRHIDEVRADDVLLGRFGSVWTLEEEELRLACLNRAICTADKTVAQMRADLFLWITNMAQGRYDAGFYLYPLNTTKHQAAEISRKRKVLKN
ncbi:hypothetical protein TRVA0_004S03620 [Trichomonascus vanleenenianus]|uniref:uncharacterized protein n=1 Tax=Trichomonascus vanleenenianus TaxID=2268995 RepID=UPI003ECB91A4